MDIDDRVAAFALVLAGHHVGDRDELGIAARAVFDALNGKVDLPPDSAYEQES